MFPDRESVVYARGVPTTIEDRLVVGDVSVVSDLFRQHGAFIHTISQELVGAAADRLTQQVFVEAWHDRLDFDPSQGTVRNWLIRRARARVSKPSAEAETAVDRLVVADSLRRMEELRGRIVLAGFGASDVETLARRLDQPAATVRANLRRGRDQLKADLAESRLVADDKGLVEIMAGGPPSLELVPPQEVVWQAVAAELGLDPSALTIDDYTEVDGSTGGRGEDDDTSQAGEAEAETVAEPDDGSDAAEAEVGDGESRSDTVDPAAPPPAASGAASSRPVDQSSRPVEATEARSGWVVPALIVLLLVVVVAVVLAAL